MVNIPVVAGAYPVVAVGSAFGVCVNVSVVSTPVADTVTTVAHAPLAMAEVPSTAVPLAMDLVRPKAVHAET